ncbi:LOB domain-containing protein [Striga asiatica]|uniref:LOB domain-containing protein n=1 Tax=Striga asiatica TaxID=4170 RepID=A0A5A7R7X5_STRAF|nr:LOB domain-containing protein [Striga asiatica]
MQDHNKKNNNKKITTNNPNPTTTTATAQACAACKYRRRKCAPDCILAPYFPHDRQPQFLNAHRLYGVSNIVKIVRQLGPADRDAAMWTIAFESDARAADPAGGLYRVVRDLERRIVLARAELEAVLRHLAACRAAAAGGVDVDSWGCAESTSSSFFQNQYQLCANDDVIIRPIPDDHFDCEDGFREEGFKFDSHGNITPSNNGGFTERAAFKQDDECLSYIQDDEDLKAAAAVLNGLTN